MNKEWYKSKTVWISAASLVAAVATAMGFNVQVDYNALMLGIAGALGITLRDAIPKK